MDPGISSWWFHLAPPSKLPMLLVWFHCTTAQLPECPLLHGLNSLPPILQNVVLGDVSKSMLVSYTSIIKIRWVATTDNLSVHKKDEVLDNSLLIVGNIICFSWCREHGGKELPYPHDSAGVTLFAAQLQGAENSLVSHASKAVYKTPWCNSPLHQMPLQDEGMKSGSYQPL